MALATSRAAAAESRPEPQPPRKDCTRAESVPLDAGAFTRNPQRYGGRCVHVRGIVVWRGFVRDRTELYDWGSGKVDSAMIAVYGEDESGGEDLWRTRTYADIVAYTYSCEELTEYSFWSAERDNAAEAARAKATNAAVTVSYMPFVSGLCHYRGGPVLWISEWTPLPELPTTLHDGSSARRYRNIDEVNERWPHFAEAHSVVAQRFEQFRKMDRAAHVDYYRKMFARMQDGQKMADQLADEAWRRFSFLSGRTDLPPIKMFLGRPSRDANGTYVAFGCVCKEADCSKRWPIHSMDTDAQPDWPYVCIPVRGEPGKPAVAKDDY